MKSIMILLAMLSAALSTPARGDPPHPAVEVAAALTLADAGVARQQAALIVTALEVLADYALIGPQAAAAKASYLTEARFLMRGDKALAARLIAATGPAPTNAPHIWIAPFQETLHLPEGWAVQRIVASQRKSLIDVRGGATQICAPRQDVWHCGFVPQAGTLQVTGQPARGGWLVLERAPKAP